MGAAKTITIRMDARTLKRIDRIARATNRSRASVINQAVERYLDYDEWFVNEVEKGLKEVGSGELVEHEALVKVWENKRAAKVDAHRQPRS